MTGSVKRKVKGAWMLAMSGDEGDRYADTIDMTHRYLP
jgi:hypothetical protein